MTTILVVFLFYMDKEIKLVLDQKTIDYLTHDVKVKRTVNKASSFSDIFLIRLTDALNKNLETQVFKIRNVTR